MSEATEYVKKIQEMTPEERAKEFPMDPVPGAPLTDAQIEELNRRRLAADKRRRAEEFATAEAQEDAEWTIAINKFVIERSTAGAINKDMVKVRWTDANLHVLVSAAKRAGFRPCVESLDEIFASQQENLCSHLEDELSQDEKNHIITRFLVQQKRLAPRYLRDNRGETIPDTPEAMLERAGYSHEEWDAAANSPQIQESFRRNALTKGYSRLTDLSISHVAPQRGKLPTLETNQLPDYILSITRSDLMQAKPEQLKMWNSVPGAKERFAEVLAAWRRGERP
jgi:hypothetical protein